MGFSNSISKRTLLIIFFISSKTCCVTSGLFKAKSKIGVLNWLIIIFIYQKNYLEEYLLYERIN